MVLLIKEELHPKHDKPSNKGYSSAKWQFEFLMRFDVRYTSAVRNSFQFQSFNKTGPLPVIQLQLS
jgi:hypothetical protein